MSEKQPKTPAAKGAAKSSAKTKDAKSGPKSVPPPSAAPKSQKAKAAALSLQTAADEAARAKAAMAPVVPTDAQKEHSFRRKIIGLVTSDKMNKTVVVEVIQKSMNPLYKKYVRSRSRYKAHDELNQYRTGDRVEIMEHRPLSAQKRWMVTRLVSRPVEA